MPQRNKTGPTKKGPMTGRRMGGCADNSYAQYRNAGNSQRRGYQGYDLDEDKPLPTKEILLEQKAFLERSLAEIEEQLKALEQK